MSKICYCDRDLYFYINIKKVIFNCDCIYRLNMLSIKSMNNYHEIEDKDDAIILLSIEVIPSIIQEIVASNKGRYDELPKYLETVLSRVITIKDYFKRIILFSKVEISTVIYSFILIDKIITSKQLVISEINIHLLLLTSLYVSAKLHEDKIYGYKIFARIGGVSPFELLKAEYMFLELLEYNLFIKHETYEQYYELLTQ